MDNEGNEITTAQDLIDQVNALIDAMLEDQDNNKPGIFS
jgi:hypothetical protein